MKKQGKKDLTIDSLAKDILDNTDEVDSIDTNRVSENETNEINTEETPENEIAIENKEIEEDIDIPEIEEPSIKDSGKIPDNKEPDIRPVSARIIFDKGTTKPTAFIIERRNEEIFSILGKYFGFRNGDYFVGNENTLTSHSNGQRKRYKCIIVEDRNGFTYTLWFDITSLGPVY